MLIITIITIIVFATLRYAYDTKLPTTTESSSKEVACFCHKLVQESKTFNMSINTKQTKLMVAGKHDSEVKLTLHEQFKQVEDFKFLGSIKTANGDCTRDIKMRTAMAK